MGRRPVYMPGGKKTLLIRMRNVRSKNNEIPAIITDPGENVAEAATGIIFIPSETTDPAQPAPAFSLQDFPTHRRYVRTPIVCTRVRQRSHLYSLSTG